MRASDQLSAILGAPIAVLPGAVALLETLAAAFDSRPVSADDPLAAPNDGPGYEVREGGVAVITVSGIVFAKPNPLSRLIGGAAMSTIASVANAMRHDSRVKSALVDFDSPGGTLSGASSAEQAIRQLAAAKPVVTLSTGRLVGPAYMVGCAANAVFASGTTDLIGGLGVTVEHRHNPLSGVQTTEVTAGRYKRIASGSAPLTAEGEDYLQGQVDELYRVMVAAVARNRGTTIDDVLVRMAEGRVFVGQQAINAGLIDGFGSVERLVHRLASDPRQFATRRRAATTVPRPPARAAASTATPARPPAGSGAPRKAAGAPVGANVYTGARAALSPRFEQLRKARELATLAGQAQRLAQEAGRALSAVDAVAAASRIARTRQA